MEVPKYALIEIERRWRVDAPCWEELPFATVSDRYLDGGYLRLRKVEGDGETVYKLGKKYGLSAGGEPVTNLYLTLEEFSGLLGVPGRGLVKRRYRVDGGALDVVDLGDRGIAIFEKEFSSVEEARAFQPPRFVGEELKPGELTGYELAGLFTDSSSLGR
jgi:hypothetical protein